MAILTNMIHQECTGHSVASHKQLKGLKSQNLRDPMTDAELIFTALAELSTREIVESWRPAACTRTKGGAGGGRIAKRARIALEENTGKKVVSKENYLPTGRDSQRLE